MARKTTIAKAEPAPSGQTGRFAEIGVAGLKVASGYVFEEYLPSLRGAQGIRTYQEMSQNDATVGAVLKAVELIIRAVTWDVQPVEDKGKAGDEAAEFVKSLLGDMSHSWADFLAEAMSMLVYGWAWHEVVLKRRIGPYEANPANRSRFTDGKIGVRKLAPRSQDTLDRWEMQDDGGIAGMWQQPPLGGGTVYLPIERSLLFRTVSRKNSPEGQSVLRTAYRAWYKLKSIEDYEAIGIERELAGLPIISIPSEYLRADAPAAHKAIAAKYEKMARDVKFNEQGGCVKPSDTYPDKDGSPTNVPLVDIKLLTSGGQRTIDTDKTIQRYQRTIARAALADFLMLGSSTGTAPGSYSMHEGKVDLFMRACEAVLDQIVQPLNRFLLPRLWRYNNIDPDLMPTIVPGHVQPTNLELLGRYIADIAGAGAPLFPDEELENYLRSEARLPEKSPEAIALQEDMRRAEEAARTAMAERVPSSNEAMDKPEDA